MSERLNAKWRELIEGHLRDGWSRRRGAALAELLNARPMKTHGWKSRRQVANGI